MYVRQVPELTAEGARRLVDAALAHAATLGMVISVVVVDRGGSPLAVHRMDGTPRFTMTVAEKKAWTAAVGGAPSDVLRDAFSENPLVISVMAPKLDDLMLLGGAVPVLVDGQIAGAVGVSGGSEEQDQQVAAAAVAALGLGGA